MFCVIEHAYRDRRVAEDACAGKFTENGVSLEPGLDPNWQMAGLPHDEEWQIAWVKFYFGLDLAAAFAQTGRSTVPARLGKVGGFMDPAGSRGFWSDRCYCPAHSKLDLRLEHIC